MLNKLEMTKPTKTINENNVQTGAEALNVSAQDFDAMGNVGAMFYEQGNLEKAQTIFEGLVEMNPESAAAQSALGALFTRKREDDTALIHLDKAIAIDDRQIAPFVNRAEVYLRQRRFEAAVADLKWAIELDPQEKDSGANRARAMVLGIYQVIESQKQQQKIKEGEKQNVSSITSTRNNADGF